MEEAAGRIRSPVRCRHRVEEAAGRICPPYTAVVAWRKGAVGSVVPKAGSAAPGAAVGMRVEGACHRWRGRGTSEEEEDEARPGPDPLVFADASIGRTEEGA